LFHPPRGPRIPLPAGGGWATPLPPPPSPGRGDPFKHIYRAIKVGGC